MTIDGDAPGAGTGANTAARTPTAIHQRACVFMSCLLAATESRFRGRARYTSSRRAKHGRCAIRLDPDRRNPRPRTEGPATGMRLERLDILVLPPSPAAD